MNPLRNAWLSKPPPGVCVDWGHPLAKGLAGCWLFNEGAGAVFRDGAGQRHGGVSGGFGTDITWSPGRTGTAIKSNANANTNRVTFPSLTTGSIWSWAAMIKATTFTDSWEALFTQGAAAGIFLRSSGLFRIEAGSGLYSNGTLSAGIWYLLVATSDGTNLRIYFNGKQDASGAAGTPTFNADGMFNDAASETFDGLCDFQYFWKDRVLSPNEVLALIAEPYDMFVPARRFVWPKAAAGGGSALTLSIADSITFTESTGKGENKTLSDTATLGEAIAKLAALAKVDALTLAEAVAKGITKNLSNGVTLSDAVVAALVLIKAVADAITLADSSTRLASKNLADSVTLSDLIARVVAITRADSVNLGDTALRSALKFLSDSVTFADAVTAAIVGASPVFRIRVHEEQPEKAEGGVAFKEATVAGEYPEASSGGFTQR